MAKPPLSRVWVLTFFVMGVIIGLLLLVLDDGLPVMAPQQAADSLPAPPVPAKPVAANPAPVKPVTLKPVPLKPPAAAKPSAPEQPLLCDREEAAAVLHKARSLAAISERDGVVELQLTREWEFYSPGHRRSFVETFSEADRCLQGRYRPLRLMYRGEEVASVSPNGAVQMK